MVEKIKSLWVKINESRWTTILLPFILLGVIVLIFALMTNFRFVTFNNLNVIIQQSLIVGTVAEGASFIFATGNRNIAMGSCTALVATLAALFYNATGSVPGMIIVAVVCGVIIMLISVALSTVLHVMVIHVTIVMMTLLKAIQEVIVGGGGISISYAMTRTMNSFGATYIIFFGFALFCIIIFHFTPWGRRLKMVGSNTEAAELTGIERNSALTLAFVMGGIGAGLGAIVTILRTASVTTFTSNGLNTDVMLAIVLGGMPVYGGSKSNAYAPLIGAVTVTALNNGLLMVGVNTAIVQGVRGVIFLLLLLVGYKRTPLLPGREG